MARISADGGFVSLLREELLQIKQQSFERTKQKTLLVISLLGLGSLSIKDSFILHFYSLLYLVPIVCFCYDVLYLGDKFAARRIGSFMRQYGKDEMSKAWETFVALPSIRGPWWMYWFGEVGITITAVISSLLILFHRFRESSANGIEYLFPVVISAIILAILYELNRRSTARFRLLDAASDMESHYHKLIIGILSRVEV
jgi:hypothetical protein